MLAMLRTDSSDYGVLDRLCEDEQSEQNAWKVHRPDKAER